MHVGVELAQLLRQLELHPEKTSLPVGADSLPAVPAVEPEVPSAAVAVPDSRAAGKVSVELEKLLQQLGAEEPALTAAADSLPAISKAAEPPAVTAGVATTAPAAAQAD